MRPSTTCGARRRASSVSWRVARIVVRSACAARNGSLSVPMCHPHAMCTSSPSTMFVCQLRFIILNASTVGMPVPRPPPCRPGRAVVPHPVPRWSALPRCTAQPSGTHAPTWNVRQTRTRALDAVADAGPLLPRVTPPLASPPVAPWERPVHRPMEDAGERAGVPAHARVVVVAPAARRQTREACPPRPLPGWWDPCRASWARGGERRAGGAPPDARHAVPLWWPAPRAAQPGAAPRRAGVPTAAPAQRGVRWCHVAVAGRPPVGPPPHPPCGVLRHAAGPPPVRSIVCFRQARVNLDLQWPTVILRT